MGRAVKPVSWWAFIGLAFGEPNPAKADLGLGGCVHLWTIRPTDVLPSHEGIE